MFKKQLLKIFVVLLLLTCFVLILLYLWTSSSLSFKERYIRPGELAKTNPLSTPLNAHPKINNQYFFSFTHSALCKSYREKKYFSDTSSHKSFINCHNFLSIFIRCQTTFCLCSTREHPKIDMISMRTLL